MDKLTSDAKNRITKAVDILKQELATIRTGRASAGLIDHVRIKAYGGSQDLTVAEMATIASSDATTLVVTPFDPSVIDELDRGLRQANLGVSISQDGEKIRVTVPPMTEERRQEFIKLARTKTEGIRIMVRQIRQDILNTVRDMFQKKEIAEDEKFRLEKEVQTIVESQSDVIERVLQEKITELETI